MEVAARRRDHASAGAAGAAVFGRTVDLTKPRASGEKHAIVFGIADILEEWFTTDAAELSRAALTVLDRFDLNRPVRLLGLEQPQHADGRGVGRAHHVDLVLADADQAVAMIAAVELDDSPDVRLTTCLVDVDVNAVDVGMAVEVVFDEQDDVAIPFFRPVTA